MEDQGKKIVKCPECWLPVRLPKAKPSSRAEAKRKRQPAPESDLLPLDPEYEEIEEEAGYEEIEEIEEEKEQIEDVIAVPEEAPRRRSRRYEEEEEEDEFEEEKPRRRRPRRRRRRRASSGGLGLGWISDLLVYYFGDPYMVVLGCIGVLSLGLVPLSFVFVPAAAICALFGMLINLVGVVWLLYAAYQDGNLPLFLAVLCIPFFWAIYVIMHLDTAGKPFLLLAIGWVLAAIGGANLPPSPRYHWRSELPAPRVCLVKAHEERPPAVPAAL
jgi:hypothetical protein